MLKEDGLGFRLAAIIAIVAVAGALFLLGCGGGENKDLPDANAGNTASTANGNTGNVSGSF